MSNPLKIRPGMLVTLSTAIRGGVTYEREDLGEERRPDGAEVEEWRTVKVTVDPEEHEEAVRVRSRVRSLMKSACVSTPFGFVCPVDDLPALDAAQAEADRLVREFNAGATHCEVRYASLRGEIAENAREAIEAIRSEIGALLRDYEDTIRAGDIRSARDIATRATQMNRLLEQESAGSGRLADAIREGRKIARLIVKRVEKGGEELADVLAEANLSPVSQARFAFLQEYELSEPESDADAEVDREAAGAGDQPAGGEARSEPARLPHIVLPPGTAQTVQITYEDDPEPEEVDEMVDAEPEGDDYDPAWTGALEPMGESESEDDDLPAVDSGRYAGLTAPETPARERSPEWDDDEIPLAC